MTPLIIGIDNSDYSLIKELLKLGIHPNIQDKYGQTALMLAAGRNQTDIVKNLIAAGVNLKNISKSELTALGFAIDNRNTECAKLIKSRRDLI